MTFNDIIKDTFKDKYIKLYYTDRPGAEPKYPEFMKVFDVSLDTKAEYYGERSVIISLMFKKEDVIVSDRFEYERKRISQISSYVYIEIDIDDGFELKDSLEEEK